MGNTGATLHSAKDQESAFYTHHASTPLKTVKLILNMCDLMAETCKFQMKPTDESITHIKLYLNTLERMH